jgi:hypothetical protein
LLFLSGHQELLRRAGRPRSQWHSCTFTTSHYSWGSILVWVCLILTSFKGKPPTLTNLDDLW